MTDAGTDGRGEGRGQGEDALGSLRLWACVDHNGHYLTGTSIAMAHDEAEARTLVRAALKEAALDPDNPFTLRELDVGRPFAIVLDDGNY